MGEPLQWSAKMKDLIRSCIDVPVWNDPRTDLDEDVLLGYPFAEVRDAVLMKGLADFRQGHQRVDCTPLTADDKAILYSYANMKRHFFACLAAFGMHRAVVEPLFGTSQKPLVLDLGCGPGTVFLALSDVFPSRDFDYLGIDAAPAMSARALVHWQAAQDRGLIGERATIAFKQSWAEVQIEELARFTAIVLTGSYFFASHTLTYQALQSLAEFVKRLKALARPIGWLYLNSTHELANRNYEVFKALLGLNPTASSPIELTIPYRKKAGGPVCQEQFVHELLTW